MCKAERIQEILGERYLTEVALHVHMTTWGSMDRVCSRTTQEEDIAALQYRLEHWGPSPCKGAEEFDAAVKNLLEVTLREVHLRNSNWNSGNSTDFRQSI